MTIYVAPAYVLSAAGQQEGWKPVFGWHNLVTISTLTADQEDESFPSLNLANPATDLVWKSGSIAAQNLTVLFGEAVEVDYLAIARHNLGTGQVTLKVEGLPVGGDSEDDGDWDELNAEQIPADDSPILFRFDPATLIGVRLVLTPGSVEPQAAVLHVGKLIVLEHGIPVGHIPIRYATGTERFSAKSQGGDYLGTVVLSGGLRSSIRQEMLSPDWYRANLEPLRAAGPEATMFVAWAPEDYPTEVGYCWVTNDPQPNINQGTGEIDITFDIEGI